MTELSSDSFSSDHNSFLFLHFNPFFSAIGFFTTQTKHPLLPWHSHTTPVSAPQINLEAAQSRTLTTMAIDAEAQQYTDDVRGMTMTTAAHRHAPQCPY